MPKMLVSEGRGGVYSVSGVKETTSNYDGTDAVAYEVQYSVIYCEAVSQGRANVKAKAAHSLLAARPAPTIV